MARDVFCELSERVVLRTGLLDLDPLQRVRYRAHLAQCAGCQVILGHLSQSTVSEDVSWPHLSRATLKELAAAGPGEYTRLLIAAPDLETHLDRCSECLDLLDCEKASADRGEDREGATVIAGRSSLTSLAWSQRRTEALVQWRIDHPLVPQSLWTVRLRVGNGRVAGHLTVDARHESVNWDTLSIVLSGEADFVATMTFSPSQATVERAVDAPVDETWTATAMLLAERAPWMAYVAAAEAVRTFRPATAESPFLLRTREADSSTTDLIDSLSSLPSALEDIAGRPVRWHRDDEWRATGRNSGSLIDPAGRVLGFWKETATQAIEIHAAEAGGVWLSAMAEELGIEAGPFAAFADALEQPAATEEVAPASVHPSLSALYGSNWRKHPSAVQDGAIAHVSECLRCRLIMRATRLISSDWSENMFGQLQTALAGTTCLPAAVGVNRMTPGNEVFRETIEDERWIVTIEEERAGIRVVVNRRADKATHPQAQVLLIGPDADLHLVVTMQPTGSWWTGVAQSENPWAKAVDALNLSIIVVDDPAGL